MVPGSRLPGGLVLLVAAALGAASGAGERSASADPATASRLKHASAAQRAEAGKAALRRHDYAGAAQDFEQAYVLGADPGTLWSAIEARASAGQSARAATLCARLLTGGEASEPYRAGATALIEALAPKLGKLDITATGSTVVAVDDVPVQSGVVYVPPGDHVVTASFAGNVLERTLSIEGGESSRVVLDGGVAAQSGPSAAETPPDELPKGDEHPDGAASPSSASSSSPSSSSSRPLSPGWLVGGGVATLVLAGVTLWSGLDTQSARAAYNAAPTRAGFDDGVGRERRTNALVATTLGLGAATAAVGVFGVDFHRASRASAPAALQVRLGPGSAGGLWRF